LNTPHVSSVVTGPAADAGPTEALWLVANARVPSPRAQTLQVLQAAASFVRAGLATTLVHARRHDAPGAPEPDGSEATEAARRGFERELVDRYALGVGPHPTVRAARCIDAIDRVPRALQFLPARAQELTFARSAARLVRDEARAVDIVLTRELEVADALRNRPRTFLELHRLPEGRLRRRWLARACERIDGVVAISGGVQEDLVAFLGERLDPAAVFVAHDAFDPERFDRPPARDEACAQLGLDAERPVVVYTGGLLTWKGVEVLVDAASDPRLADAQVIVAGGMEADVERLRRYAGSLANVRIDGFQPARQVPVYLGAADVGVVPNRSTPAISARYTSPLKVFEARAVGLPLVVSDLPSLREVLDEDEAVFVAPDDAGALADGIVRLLADGPERARRSARLRAGAAAHTWDARAGRIIAWMRARIARRRMDGAKR
jgi:glycosyltransferase involved in cell wall biosynthesis